MSGYFNQIAKLSGEDYNEKLNLAISSGELPDIISVNASQLEMLIKAGMIEDFISENDAKTALVSGESRKMLCN